jgi:DNA-binding response OmpR family regulator
MNALLICDDPDETAILSLVLQRVGLAPVPTADLDKAMVAWPQQPADLVLVAVRPCSPAELTRLVRHTMDAPLVIICDATTEDALCRAYEAGVDWVATRPYSARLLSWELRAIVQRTRGVPLLSLPSLRVDDLTLDASTRLVRREGTPPRRLTHLEFRLLYTLMMHRGQTLPTATLVERVWGYEGEGNMDLVRGLISRLRAKIEENPRLPRYIVTVPGVGYRLSSPQE